MHPRLLTIVALFILLAVVPGRGSAQTAAPRVRASQTGSVMQEVDRTKITLTYDRPVARGRALFGAVVKLDSMWMPGANWATTIEVSDDVLVQGAALAKGRYSVWAVPGASEWTIIFSRRDRAWHTQYPGESEDALRVRSRIENGAHMETLAWYFPVVASDSAVLRLHWGTTMVPLAIRLKPVN